MRPASRKIGDHSAHAVSLEESTRTSSRVKKSSCGVADHLEFTEDPELPARGVLRGDLSAKQNFFCRLCGNHASTANFHARSNAASNGRRASSER